MNTPLVYLAACAAGGAFGLRHGPVGFSDAIGPLLPGDQERVRRLIEAGLLCQDGEEVRATAEATAAERAYEARKAHLLDRK